MNQGTDTWRRLRLVVGYGIAVAAVYFTVRRLDLSASDLWLSISAQKGWSLLAVLFLFLLHGAMNAVAFGWLLRSFGANSSIATSASAWGVSVLAKYIPGGIWQVVGRGVVLHRQGVASLVMLRVSILEQVISLTACVAVMLVASRISGGGIYLAAWSLGPVMLLIAISLPWWVSRSLGILRARAYVFATMIYVLALAPYAAAYLLLVLPGNRAGFVQHLFEGTVAGILALFAPGGLGVRESWVAISEVEADGGQVLAALILARVLIIISEVALTVLAVVHSRWSVRHRQVCP